MRELKIPLTDDVIRDLQIGDAVGLSGTLVTGRDAAHQWLVETFIRPHSPASAEDMAILAAIQPILDGGVIYHCGPVVSGITTGQYRVTAAGPTTSAREETYQADVMRFFNLKGVLGKGGMSSQTLTACQEVPAVYFHAIGGAAALIARSVRKVVGVHKLEFGVPEALWILEVERLCAVVTMDARGGSLHESVRQSSKAALERLIG